MTNDARRSLAMALAENAEALYDFLIENEAVKAFPILSTAVRLLEGADDVRSRLLQQKILTFVSEPALVHSAESGMMRLKLQREDKYADAVGDTLFLTLEKVTDMKKPRLLARVFAYYLGGRIDTNELLMLTHSIDASSLVDLEKFVEVRSAQGHDETGWHARLAATGLLISLISAPLGQSNLYYSISSLGEHFLEAVGFSA